MHQPINELTHLHKLLRTGKKATFERGDTITTTEDTTALFLVEKGFVKRFQITNAGTINVHSIYGPKDIFSLTFVFQLILSLSIYDGPDTYCYEALDDVTTYEFDGDQLKAAVAKEPLLYRDLLSVAGHRFRSNIQMLENKSLPSTLHRVAHIMLYYIEAYAAYNTTRLELIVPLTQQDIADILSVTRESVSTAISSLRKQGIVEGTRIMTVPSMARLKEIAYSS